MTCNYIPASKVELIPDAMMPVPDTAYGLEDHGSALLVAELHHRVMNSFQVISALAMRCGRVKQITELSPILGDLENRLSAFASVHRQLAMPPSSCFVEHCRTLGHALVAAFGRLDAVHVRMDPVNLPPRSLARISLIVAELTTNCLKHSLRSAGAGSIHIELRIASGQLVIEAQDSAACPISGDPPEPSRIVAALATSLGGSARVIDNGGYCVRITLPLQARRAFVVDENEGLVTAFPSPPVIPARLLTPARRTSDVHL